MTTVGTYLATRLAQVGVRRHFVVPGDYNLLLLDKLESHPDLSGINCTNELNCSMAAEGYARAVGISACVVTFSVGAFSAFNGVGSAYGEGLPLILIVGSPNTNDLGSKRLLHHSIGTKDFNYELEMAKHITCAAVRIQRGSDAPRLIDEAIHESIKTRKPCYIEVPTNLANQPCAHPGPISAILNMCHSDKEALRESSTKAAEFIKSFKKVTILVGTDVRSGNAEKEVVKLAEAMGCGVAVTADAKSFFPEDHPQFVGIYWGEVGSRCSKAIIDWSDAVICIGTVFTDYSTVGWTGLPSGKLLSVELRRVNFPQHDYVHVNMADFLTSLAAKVEKKPATLVEYHRLRPEEPVVCVEKPAESLNRREMQRQIHGMVTPNTTLFVDTGDSWFNGIHMTLPRGARFEIEMQWGHIGWSVPACLGYAAGLPDRQVICMVGDGSFQVTAQELANAVRLNLPIIFILINNGGYTIEVEIHDGLYNNIQGWDYSAIIETFNNGTGHGKGWKAKTAGELTAAIKAAKEHRKGPSLIECVIDRDDCSKELITWGHLVSQANAKPPADS
ncbi:hypothetical protein KEM56_000011 [Ascosphaera pollenicola]|nr:hypothetical protein KEM56_000011 [Ascosphaera pollenicola]